MRRRSGTERGEAASGPELSVGGRRVRESRGHLRGAPGPPAPVRVYEYKSQTSRKE